MTEFNTAQTAQIKQKNRYWDAPKNPDYTINQQWHTYSAAEHNRWDRLFRRQLKLLPGRACDEFIQALQTLELSQSGIPHMEKLSDRLEKISGWRVVPVAGLVPDEGFFEHLANKRFPAGAFIRPANQLDYLEEPDVFHDIFGHVPMLADPVFSKFMQAYGQGGLRADGLGVLHHLARLYWYTVEFGLVQTAAGLRIYGAGIVSSNTETVFALDDDSPNRIGFELERLMRTRYIIDDFQQSYFVLDSLQQLLDDTAQDFAPVYQRVRNAGDLDAHVIEAGDKIIQRGTLRYFTNHNRVKGQLDYAVPA
jgi:phenylalanine-4-hydroxylase